MQPNQCTARVGSNRVHIESEVLVPCVDGFLQSGGSNFLRFRVSHLHDFHIYVLAYLNS